MTLTPILATFIERHGPPKVRIEMFCKQGIPRVIGTAIYYYLTPLQ